MLEILRCQIVVGGGRCRRRRHACRSLSRRSGSTCGRRLLTRFVGLRAAAGRDGGDRVEVGGRARLVDLRSASPSLRPGGIDILLQRLRRRGSIAPDLLGASAAPSVTAISNGPLHARSEVLRDQVVRLPGRSGGRQRGLCPVARGSATAAGSSAGSGSASAASAGDPRGRLAISCRPLRPQRPLGLLVVGWRCEPASEWIWGPTIARKAGSSVSAASTATTTAIAAIRPIVVTSGIPATASESERDRHRRIRRRTRRRPRSRPRGR